MLRAGHGNGKGKPHVELPKLADLPSGHAAPEPAPACQAQQAPRAADGRLVPGDSTSALASRAASARWLKNKTRVRALEALGLRAMAADAAVLPYFEEADEFARHEIERLARVVGGGACGASASSMVQSAALQLAASRYLYASGDPLQFVAASRLADASRQNLLSAHTVCALEAKARPKQGNAILAAIEAAGAEAP